MRPAAWRLPLLLACLLAGSAACRKGPPAAALGSLVRLEYTLTVAGRVDDSNAGAAPVELVVGSGVLPRQAEQALVGMRVGDEKWVKLPAVMAYGARDPGAVAALPRASFGKLAADLAPGKVVLGLRDGQPARGRVERLDGSTVWVDFNHRLAGQDVSFRLKVLALRERP